MAEIQAALTDSSTRAIVAVGPAGAGKTALLADVLTDMAGRGALTGTAKHVERDPSQDMRPFVAALEQAVAAGLERLYDPDAGLESLGLALGASASLFRPLGGGLLGSLPAERLAPVASADAAEERVVQACIATLRWLQGFGVPVLLQIDDWGRAGAQATRLYGRVISEPDLASCRLLVSQRLEEPGPFEAAAGCRRIEIGPIPEHARREIIAQMLDLTAENAEPIARLIGAAGAFPFDLIQGLQGLAFGGGLVRGAGGWKLDRTVAGVVLGAAVPEAAAVRMIEDDTESLAVAQLLALFGDVAQHGDLLTASQRPQALVDAAISTLVQVGLVRRTGDTLALTHDRLRAAILRTLTTETRARLSGQIAESWVAAGTAPDADARSMTMLWLRLAAGLDDADPERWTPHFHSGARAARALGDRNAADTFAEAAMVLADRSGSVSHYVLMEATYAAAERGDHDLAIARSELMPAASTSPREQAEADEMRVFTRRMAGDLTGAITVAREMLARSGVRLPAKPSIFNIAATILAVQMASPRWAWRQPPYSEAELAVAAPMMRAANATGSLLFEHDIWMAVLLVARSVPVRMAAGTASGAGAYAVMSAMIGNYRRAGQWAELSDHRQSPDQPLRAVASQYARSFGHWFTRPHRDLLVTSDPLEALAYVDGDLAVAAYANQDRVLDALMGLTSLPRAIEVADRGLMIAERLKDVPTALPIAALRQVGENLARPGDAPWRIDGAFFDDASRARLEGGGLTNALRLTLMLEALLAVSYGAYEVAAALHARAGHLFGAAPFQNWTQSWCFLTALALYRSGGRPARFPVWNLRRIARLNPTDNRHRVLLLDAEVARLAGRAERAIALYGLAVEFARGGASLIELGIVADAAAEGAAMLGRSEADRFAAAALEAWTKLGAIGVVASRHRKTGSSLGSAMSMAAAEPKGGQPDRERQLEAARDAALRTSRAKSRFLATIGHELRTPLQGLVGLVDMARKGGEALDLDTLGGAVSHLQAIVNDITDLGALEGGIFPLARKTFDPLSTLAGVASLHRPALAGTDRSIRLHAPRRLERVAGDEARVRQVLSNLVGNAVKYGQGDILLRLDAQPSDTAIRLSFSVTDEGPGPDPSMASRLFEPFERGAGAEQSEGLGLGLPLARALARRMGGDVTFSGRARGCRFLFTLPAPLAGTAPPAPSPETFTGVRVLLAEDTPLSRRVLAAMLRAQGCEVTEAADGATALALWREGTFDLALLDQRMPGLDGLALAGAIREEPGGEALPIVIATAAPTRALQDAAATLGSTFVVSKPIGWSEVAHLLGRAPTAARRPSDRLGDIRAALGEAAGPLINLIGPTLDEALAEISFAPADDLARRAHRLAGLASNFGLDDLAQAALDLERAATERRVEPGLIDAVAVAVRAARLTLP